MFLEFNKQRMHIQIICGTLEEYSPTEEIKEVYERVEKLKAQLAKFQEDVVFPEMKQIDALIENINPKPKSEEK